MDSNAVMWALVVGFLMPILVAVAQQPGWRDWVRALVAGILCVAAGAVTVYVEGNWDTTRLVTTCLLVFVTAVNVYKRFWIPLGIERLERATYLGDATPK